MSAVKARFIGGPWDGQQRAIHSGEYRLRVRVARRVSFSITPLDATTAPNFPYDERVYVHIGRGHDGAAIMLYCGKDRFA